MSLRQLEILGGGLTALLCVALAWQLLCLPAAPRGGISVRFVGFTNAASGAISGQFTVSNAFGHALIFAGAAPQIRLTNSLSAGSGDGNPGNAKGWSPGSHYGYPGNPVFTVAPHTAHTFAVALSNVDGAVWRVPLAYDKVNTAIERWSEDIKATLGLPVAQNRGMYTNTPQIFGLSNYSGPAVAHGLNWYIDLCCPATNQKRGRPITRPLERMRAGQTSVRTDTCFASASTTG